MYWSSLLSDVGELEVDFVGDALHGGQDKLLHGILAGAVSEAT